MFSPIFWFMTIVVGVLALVNLGKNLSIQQNHTAKSRVSGAEKLRYLTVMFETSWATFKYARYTMWLAIATALVSLAEHKAAGVLALVVIAVATYLTYTRWASKAEVARRDLNLYRQ